MINDLFGLKKTKKQKFFGQYYEFVKKSLFTMFQKIYLHQLFIYNMYNKLLIQKLT